MPHTDNDTTLAIAIRTIIQNNMISLGINDVLYGNHTQVPSDRTVIVKALGRQKQLVGVQGPGGRTDNSLNVQIEVHISAVGDEETLRKEVDDLATAIEDLLNNDVTVGGIIIHGYITDVGRGETFINNSMFRSVIMSYSGKTRTLIS